MSKELLEEIINNLPYTIRHEGNTEELIEYAKEQAERAQELEQQVEDYRVVNRELHERRRKLRKQNKRYRERIEYMLEEAKDHKRKGLRIQHWALIKDLEDTLEGERCQKQENIQRK